MESLTELSALVPGFMLVLTRMTAFLVSAPILGGPYAPMQVKILIALAMGICAYPGAMAHGVHGAHGQAIIVPDAGFLLLLAQEVFFGLAMGWLVSLLSHGVRMGGELISRYAGFTAAENFDPDADVGAGPFSDILFIALVLVFFATDTHHYLIAAMVHSYDAAPLGAPLLTGPAMGLATVTVSHSVMAACAVAFPVLGVVMALTVVEGILSRAVPQINLLHISFAVKIGMSLIVTIAGLPAIIAFLHACLDHMRSLIGPAMRAMA